MTSEPRTIGPYQMNTRITHSTSCPFSSYDGASKVATDEFVMAVTTGETPHGQRRVGVLLVNHGSRSPTWRHMLLDMHANVADELLGITCIGAVRTAFMEYTEPSIATQLRAFDRDGFDEIILIPLLLTISDHSLDDIPTICGQACDTETVHKLRKEKIEIYTPQARLHTTPLLDYSGVARTSIKRRAHELFPGGLGPNDGIVLVGYGSEECDDDWNSFFRGLCSYVEDDLGAAAATYAWCGHIARYKREPTITVVRELLARTDRVGVIPILVAHDEMFQDHIIGGAVHEAGQPSRVHYRPDAVLPEPAVDQWIITAAREMTMSIEHALRKVPTN